MAQTHTYTSTYPPTPEISSGIKTFFETFYKVSDTPSATDEYVSSFADDATFAIGIKQVKGTKAIRTMREGMWEVIVSRKHTPIKVFPFGNGSGDNNEQQEVMLYGTVEYGFRDGGKKTVEWAARAQLVKDEQGPGGWKFGFYQVYLDSAAMKN